MGMRSMSKVRNAQCQNEDENDADDRQVGTHGKSRRTLTDFNHSG